MATKKQHYIPRMILKNYTYFGVPMSQPLIFQYDLQNGKELAIPVSSVHAHEKNLYELKDDNGNIIESTRNAIEQNLSIFESNWAKIIVKIEDRKELSDDELAWLYFLIPIQLLRMPDTLEMTSQWLRKWNSELTEPEAARYARMASLIIGCPDPQKSFLLNKITEFACTRQLIAMVSSPESSAFVLNGLYPAMALLMPYIDDMTQCQIYYPLAPHICIGLVNAEVNGDMYRNITPAFVDFLNKQFVKKGGRFLYSSESIRERVINIQRKGD